ncbi:MAG: hypothetical protein JWP31_2200 [Aeromicrobium sp.]|nr:hypothetical protein [Aeromicrobium sp.]
MKAASITTGAALLAAGVAFLVNILMARQLGPSSRGDVAWALQWSYVVGPLLALGVDRQALRGVARGGARLTQLHVWALGLLGVGVAATLGSFAAVACIATAAISASIAIERGTGMATNSLRLFAWLSVGFQLWILGASLALYVGGVDDVRWWLGVYAAPAPVLLAAAVIRTLDGRRLGARARIFGSTSRQSLQYMLGGIGALLAARVERLLLPAVASPRELGLYVSVATASELLVWAARGLGESRVAGLVGVDVSRGDLARLAIRNLFFFAAAAVPVGLGIGFVLIPLLGPGFEDATVLVVPLCMSSALWSTFLQVSAAWLARGSVRQSAALDVSAAALTAVLVLLAAPQHGALGAAWACVAAYGVMTTVGVARLPRPTRVRAGSRRR